jgi:hypothetical protein
MGRNHFRVAAWLLALFTCFAVAGTHSAYAWDHAQNPRVDAGGWYNSVVGATTAGPAKVNFGINGRCKDGGPTCTTSTKPALGEYEYFNHNTGVRAHGKITYLSFGTASAACLAATDGTVFDKNGNPGTFAGRPSAVVEGSGDDGSTFKAEVVDADDGTPKFFDTVCLIEVTGHTKMVPLAVVPEQDSNDQVIHGNIEVKNAPNTMNVY